MDELTRTLGGQSRHRERRGRKVALTLALMLLPSVLPGQSAEQLYAEGAYRAAAEVFAERAEQAPGVAAHWYGLGAAEYRAGSDARAAAAWQRAARLAPRHGSVRRALRLVPPPDATSARRLWIAPVSPAELALAGLVVWLGAWVLVYRNGRRVRLRHLALMGLALGLGAGALAIDLHYDAPVAIALGAEPLRISPHERADEVGPAEPGTAFRVLRAEGGWTLVEGTGARRGWLRDDALGTIRE